MWMSVSCLRIKNNKYKCQSHGVTCDGSNTEGKEKAKMPKWFSSPHQKQGGGFPLIYLNFGEITWSPPMKGLSGSGINTEPSSCWKFSSRHTIIRGTAQAVALRVCTNWVGAALPLPFFELTGEASDKNGRNRMPSLRLW